MSYKLRQFLSILIPIAIGVYLVLVLHIPSGWFFFVIGGFMVYITLRAEPVTDMVRALSLGQLERAENIARSIQQPDLLSPHLRVYYAFAQGWIALERGRVEEARIALSEALAGNLRTTND